MERILKVVKEHSSGQLGISDLSLKELIKFKQLNAVSKVDVLDS